MSTRAFLEFSNADIIAGNFQEWPGDIGAITLQGTFNSSSIQFQQSRDAVTWIADERGRGDSTANKCTIFILPNRFVRFVVLTGTPTAVTGFVEDIRNVKELYV